MASNYDVHSHPPEIAQQIQNNTSINNTSTIYIIQIYIKALIIAKLTYLIFCFNECFYIIYLYAFFVFLTVIYFCVVYVGQNLTRACVVLLF